MQKNNSAEPSRSDPQYGPIITSTLRGKITRQNPQDRILDTDNESRAFAQTKKSKNPLDEIPQDSPHLTSQKISRIRTESR